MAVSCSTSAAVVAIQNWHSCDYLVSAADLCAKPVYQFAQSPPLGCSGAADYAQSGSVSTRTPPGTEAELKSSR